MRGAKWPLVCALALGTVPGIAAPGAPWKTDDPLDRMHADGVSQFRVGRFSSAYGRFVRLADVGHPPSAHYAMWMCLHGLELFGKDWDCTGDQLQDWAQLVGAPVPLLVARQYGRYAVPFGRPVDPGRAAAERANLPGRKK